MSRPATWKIRTTASVTSGPIPSPGISVMTLAMCCRRSVARERCHAFGEERRHGLQHLLIGGPERGRAIAVDVELAEHLAALHDRHDDLGLRVEAARQVARIRIHVVDDDGRLLGGGCAADAAAERDMS